MNKIIPIDDKEFAYESGQIGIDDVTIQYVQGNDCTEEEGVQTLTVSTRNNGIARFVNIKTGEEGFSIDDPEEIVEIINDFKRRAGLCSD